MSRREVVLGLLLALAGCDRTSDFELTEPSHEPPSRMMVGLSNMSVDVADIADDLGIQWARQTIGWDDLELVVEPDDLTIEQAFTDAALEAFVASHDFAFADHLVTRFTERGIAVVVAVGSGWVQATPKLGDGRPAAPDTLGQDAYLARQVLVVRALVERYDGDGWLDAPGHPRAQVWQVENELNEAAFTGLGGARYPGGVEALSSSWADRAYVDRLFHTLVLAVRQQDPSGIVTTNLHTSVSAELDRAIGVLPWDEQLLTWLPDLDWIGLDSYPNYISAWPLETRAIGQAVARAVELGQGRPVVIIETGYPSGPRELGYDQKRQRQFMLDAFDEAEAAGATALFWYGTRSSEQTTVEITQRDLATIDRVAKAYASGNLRDLVGVMIEDTAYFQDHLAKVMSAGEGYWGVIAADGSHKPAWNVLRWEEQYR